MDLSDFLDEFVYWFIKVIGGIAALIFIAAPFALALTLSIMLNNTWFMFFFLSIVIFWPLAFVIVQNCFDDI